MWRLLNRVSRLQIGRCKGRHKTILIENNNTLCTKTITFVKPRRVESFDGMKWFVLVIPVGSFGLGCWQTARLRWKLDLIGRLEKEVHADPVPLPDDLSELARMEYRPVELRGRFLHERELLVGPRALVPAEGAAAGAARGGSLLSDPKTNQGWLVVTPFQCSDTGVVVLVNRGWVPQRLRAQERRRHALPADELQLVGLVRLTEARPPFMPRSDPAAGRWTHRDLAAMSAHTGAAPVWLDARGPPAPPGWPVPNQTRLALRNEHFSYLATWFSLAACTGFMWYRRFVKRTRLL